MMMMPLEPERSEQMSSKKKNLTSRCNGYTITVFEIPGGVRSYWWRSEGQRFLCFEAGGQTVGYRGEVAQRRSLKEGQVMPLPGSWFWNVDDGNLPMGPFMTANEALEAARFACGRA
jgi:hypothetical protein